MKSTTTNFTREDILGNVDPSSDQVILNPTQKQWWQKLGYCSILAAVPAMLVSQTPAAHADQPKDGKLNVAGRPNKLLERLNKPRSTPALLKRQSKFLLPHQSSGLATSGGPDDCPGQSIPGGNYTAAAPYINQGDTTGADDTVTAIPSYYYYNYSAHGPDHVYTFTLTSVGPNPRVEVSTTSSSYKPMIYILGDVSPGACPAGTGNVGINDMGAADSRWWSNNSTAALPMNYLPLNVPLHLFIDSEENDASGAGPYTIKMQDVTIAAPASPNVIDDSQFFVRQQYLDFLNRQPDPDGLAFWTNQITSCGGDQACIEVNRINDSGAFFLSMEFQETGYLAYRMYKAAYGNLANAPVPIKLSEFQPDAQQIGQGVIVKQSGWEQVLEANKQAFAADFVQRARFTSVYPTTTTPDAFVDTLFTNAVVTPTGDERSAAIAEFGGMNDTADAAARARALRRVAENPTLAQQEFNRAFVLMQYFGYLRRNPNDAPEPNLDFQGYNFWLNKLDSFNGDFIQAQMVKAFISSNEYRRRFGS